MAMKVEKVSELTTNRLSLYLRCLEGLAEAGRLTISSDDLAREFHFNSAQIRKDLAYFGEFGVRGKGYEVETLRDNLRSILGLDKCHKVALIGAGNLGSALVDYYGFHQRNFHITAVFDSDPDKIGQRVKNIEISDMKNFSSVAKRDNIEVAVIAVPGTAAQSVLEIVSAAGIKAVMNFAPVPLKVSSDVKLNTVDLTTSLESLSYFLAQPPRTNGSETLLKSARAQGFTAVKNKR
ncbi:MAG: redox-sensing transcriptional repressor Rex [Blastocatellia bacterium]|nr:redox-sensing transcriptional repressor Rex [Blastocatellia bacterium]